VIVRGGYYARYVDSGHIVYLHDGTLFAVPFDPDRLEITGQAVPAVHQVMSVLTSGSAQLAISDTGSLAYVVGMASGQSYPVIWLTQDGKLSPLREAGSLWSNPQFSPDGQKIALDIVSNSGDVWIYDWLRDTPTRLTFANDNRKPVWTPDGRRIVFGSDRDGSVLNLYWQRSDGSGEVQRLTDSPNLQYPASWHPDGKHLAFWEVRQGTRSDLMILPLEGDEKSGWKPGKPEVFLGAPAIEEEPTFSPDGRWIAYQSNESGSVEIYVRPFPGPGGRWQVSTAGGADPTWSRTRNEIFYREPSANHIMVAAYTVGGDSFQADKPRVWTDKPIRIAPKQRAMDLHPDGKRFAVSAVTNPQFLEKHDKVIFILNFFDELRRIAPTAKK
jgi:serine/threonine-protein kinase